ncbi:MAG: hypothetical protein ACRDI0_10940 [Actinomycetota bacterium]
MPDIAAYQHGICPRSEALVAATRDLERGRTTPDAVEELFRREREGLISVQREAGLDLLSDGLLRWQDIFRPLVEATPGLDAETLVRWFDNNSFFRAPRVTRPLGPVALPRVFEGPPEPAVATLPSPYLFSRAAQADGDRDELLERLAAEVLAPVAEGLAGRGYRLIHLEEPWLTFFGIDERSWDPLARGLRAIRDAAGGAPVVLHTYYGDAAPHADRLRRLPVDAVGIDFVETDVDALPAPWETGLLVGCVDGRRSVLETPDVAAKFVEQAAERLEPTALYVSSNSEVELLPRDVAEGKIRLLGEVATLVKESLR